MISSARKAPVCTAIAVVAALALAGCGEEAPPETALIPQSEANALIDLLDEAQKAYDEGDCGEVGSTLGQLRNRLGEKTAREDVDPAVMETLTTSVERLEQLSRTCEPATTAPITTAPITTAPVEPTTPPPTTEEVEPTTVEETTTEEETVTEKEPPEEPPGGGPPETPRGQSGEGGEGGGGGGEGGDE